MKLICENSNSLHINANGVRGDAADTIGLLDTLLPLCTLVIIGIGGGNMGAVGAVAPIVHLSEGQCPHGLCSVQQ